MNPKTISAAGAVAGLCFAAIIALVALTALAHGVWIYAHWICAAAREAMQ